MHLLRRRTGFTLLELLVVVAILAVVAGGLIVSYDGLEEKSAQGQATFNLNALDKSVRTFRVLNKSFPDNFDSLLVADTGAATTTAAATGGSTPTAEVLGSLPSKLKGKLAPYTLTQGAVDALNAVGITQLRYVGSSLGAGNADAGSIPNRIFDNTTRGRGVSHTLVANNTVAVVEGLGFTTFTQAATATPTPTADSTRLRDIAGLDENLAHVVVAVGLGNQSTMIKTEEARAGGLSEAPFYGNVLKNEYSRYVLLFHLGSSTDATLANVGYFSEARFIGVIDTKGDWYDEEYAEYTNQKS